ncbi:Callose synthase 9 [Senna tora]|uniref:Callose synthase 9 n=1 Tax=Senna tora TaxID=362788 RepID=A0A835CBX3_9FABA|nr:Callose synthase 9 [Senna tora]
MRNLLEEFHCDHGLRRATILGVREHVFTGSVSSLASFMSNQETSFVTLGQRVLANPLKVRMHYGHPDVFDRVFHITRGGISKASRVINISEDIYSGFNSTLRQGNVGKGRDVGLNQIAVFEGKVAGGNGEQVLSRDVYRLGQLFDFFRMLSFYYTTVGYYFCTMLTVLTVYIFLYGKAYLALSGLDETIDERAKITNNEALSAALNTQFLLQIGIFTAIPMILGFILEQGFLRAIVSFVTMQFQLCSVFFTFSLGTRTHYFGRTILHGGARVKKVHNRQLLGLGFLQCLLWAATGGSAAAGPVGPHRRDCRRRCLPSVPLPVVSDVGGSPESLYAFLSSVSRIGHLRTPRLAAGDSQTWTTAASDRGSRWYAGVLTAGSLLLSGFAFLGVYGGVSVFALDFGIEKAFGEYGGSIVFISLAVKDGSKASRQDKPSSWVSERVSYADIVKNLEGGVGRRDDNGSEGRSRNGIRESLAPQNKFKKTLKIHLDPNGRRRVEWVLERRVQQPRSPLRLALSKGPPEIHKSQQQPKKRVNWALHDTTRKNGTKRANESRVEELGQVKAQSSLKKVVNGSDGGRNEAIRPLALTWVAKGVDKVKKGTEVMGSVLGPVSGEGSEYNSSTHASSKGKEVIQEVDLGPSCSGTKGEMTSHSFFDAEALSSDTSDTETVDDDSLISHFENEEGLLIEQLEREFMEEQKQQNKEAEVPLDGFAVLFGGEGEEATHGGSTMSYILLTLSSWFMALSWLFAPYLFNPSGFEWQKVVEDFRDWTNWLLYRGGIGVKGEESWEAWWDEELAHIRSIGSRIAETILSLRFFIFQYGIVYKLHLQGDDTSLTVYGLSWIVLAVLIILFKVFSFSQKISVNFQLLLRFIQGLSFMLALAGLVVAVIFTKLSVPDIFACILAFIPTGWGILSIAAAWKPVMKRVGLWKSIRSIARLYDAGMGMLIFIPIALFSWFPFVSTFQTRLMFNQAFSRGLEISLILAGNNPNTGV